jgi:hypothetical protein
MLEPNGKGSGAAAVPELIDSLSGQPSLAKSTWTHLHIPPGLPDLTLLAMYFFLAARYSNSFGV